MTNLFTGSNAWLYSIQTIPKDSKTCTEMMKVKYQEGMSSREQPSEIALVRMIAAMIESTDATPVTPKAIELLARPFRLVKWIELADMLEELDEALKRQCIERGTWYKKVERAVEQDASQIKITEEVI